jgi:hypothetical protein
MVRGLSRTRFSLFGFSLVAYSSDLKAGTRQAEQAAEKVVYFVILSGAKNLS